MRRRNSLRGHLRHAGAGAGGATVRRGRSVDLGGRRGRPAALLTALPAAPARIAGGGVWAKGATAGAARGENEKGVGDQITCHGLVANVIT